MSETPPEISPHHELPDDNFKWSGKFQYCINLRKVFKF